MRIKPVLFAFFIASLGFSGEAGAQFPPLPTWQKN